MAVPAGLVLLLVAGLLVPVPEPLFDDPYATVLESEEGKFLGARIADDGQWRFPPMDSLPDKYVQSVLLFEDRYFYQHPGVNPVSIARAFWQNIKAGEIVSGGSTITMQVARMARGNNERSYFQKAIEIWLALRLELKYSKDEILRLYANHAPFGGNVVGINAAAWRYYDRSPFELSWAETANLTILPNAPGLIFPGKEDNALLAKRNNLLIRLYENGKINESLYRLSRDELIPDTPIPLPQTAKHLLDLSALHIGQGNRVISTLNYQLQNTVNEIVNYYHLNYKYKQIHNAAALVVEVATGEVKAYVGNVGNEGHHGQEVDIIQSRRSPGSLLKPVLYALAIDEGLITPEQLLPDIPVHYQGFAPQNFDKKFKGAVFANNALRSSLNVPFVNLLREYGYEKMHHKLQQLGVYSLDKPPGHYGLTMILGGGEVTLWEMTGLYAGMARSLFRYHNTKGTNRYYSGNYNENIYRKDGITLSLNKADQRDGLLNVSAVWHTLKAMQELRRPDEESNWKQFGSSRSIAWKTGTSFGHKDAWALGLNSKYVVGVWLGNADGEGRPDLTGITVAAPLLFRIFEVLDGDAVFPEPVTDMAPVTLCTRSGYKAGPDCNEVNERYISKSSLLTGNCPYHQVISLDDSERWQVNSTCYPVHKMHQRSWFILPPAQAWYYKKTNSDYTSPPDFMSACINDRLRSMEMIYPRHATKVYVPKEIDGQAGRVVFEAAHQNPDSKIYWHLDEEFVGVTKYEHKLGLYPETGSHLLSLLDEKGRELKLQFEVLNETGSRTEKMPRH